MASRLRRTQGGTYSAPKTVLGFYAGVLAILEVGVVSAIGVLASQHALLYLVPWVLAFGAIVLVLLIAVVVAINIKAPMKLQLGQVSGQELIEYERLTLGDSIAGDHTEEITVRRGGEAPALPPIELPQSVDDQEAGA
jgi:hypothetical protein